MTSNIENELRAQVSEFAKSDEALKEIIARLSELEGLIAANQKSRDSLDTTTTSINQLAANLGSFLTLSVDSVGNISKVSTDIGSTIQRIESGINSAVTSNLAEVTKEIKDAVTNIGAVSEALAKRIELVASSQQLLSDKLDQNKEKLDEKFDAIESAFAQELNRSTTKLQISIGVSTILLVIVVLLT
jgi:methyl-accepting chemotaxis protein